MHRRAWQCAVLLTFAAAVAGAAFAGTTILRNVHVVPMDTERVSDPVVVVVRDGRIVRIAPVAGFETPLAAEEIDGEGGYLIPGLVDAHMHYRHADDFLNYLSHGVTTVLGLGQPEKDLGRLREIQGEIAAGDRIGPRIYTTGGTIANHVDLETAEAGRAYVQRLKREGYDLVKVYNEIPREVFDAVVEEARLQGLSVFGHVPRNYPAEYSLAHGLNVVAHAEELYFTWFGGPRDSQLEEFDASDVPDSSLVDGVVELMLEHEVALIPNLVFTFNTMQLWNDEEAVFAAPEMAYLHPSVAAAWRAGSPARRDRIRKRMLRERIKYSLIHELTRRAHEAGVMIVTGSDAPLPGLHPGKSVHGEMRELVKAGFSYFETLSAATRTAGELVARFVDPGARIGRVEPGYEADLVLLQDNPLEDIRHAAEISGVMSDGRWHPRSELERLRRERSERYAVLSSVSETLRAAVAEGSPAADLRALLGSSGIDDPDGQEFARTVIESVALGAYRAGDIQEVLRVVTLNTELFPGSAEGWDTLGQVYEATGELGKALAAYRRALEADPAFEHARRQAVAIEARQPPPGDG